MREKLNDLELAQMSYQIVTGHLSRHRSFQYWKEHWPQLVRSLGSGDELADSEFTMQDKATLILSREDIVGIHLIKTYDAKDLETHSYFSNYDDRFVDELKKRGVKRVQALQYFMVDEKFSVARTLVNFGAIIAGLSLRHQLADGLDASVTLARADIPVTSLGLKLGFEQISTRMMHNVPVSMLACFTPQPYPKDEVNRWIDYFWARRSLEFVGTKAKVA